MVQTRAHDVVALLAIVLSAPCRRRGRRGRSLGKCVFLGGGGGGFVDSEASMPMPSAFCRSTGSGLSWTRRRFSRVPPKTEKTVKNGR